MHFGNKSKLRPARLRERQHEPALEAPPRRHPLPALVIERVVHRRVEAHASVRPLPRVPLLEKPCLVRPHVGAEEEAVRRIEGTRRQQPVVTLHRLLPLIIQAIEPPGAVERAGLVIVAERRQLVDRDREPPHGTRGLPALPHPDR